MSGTHEFVPDERNQKILVYVNGELFPRDEAKVSVFDSAFLVGDGFWESFRLHNGKLAFVAEHLARLQANSKMLDYELDKSPQALIDEVYKTVRANNMTTDVHIRMMITRGNKRTPSQDPRTNIGGQTVVIIAEHKTPSRNPDQGVRLSTVYIRRGSPDVQDPKLHTHSKLNCILACIEATHAGADEALMLDPHGFVSTCNSTNFFIVRGNQVWTSTGKYCLNGITRGNVISLCKQNGIEILEKDFSVYDTYSADEAFTTGTFGGITYVSEIDRRAIGDGTRGPMTKRLQTLYAQLLDRECPIAQAVISK